MKPKWDLYPLRAIIESKLGGDWGESPEEAGDEMIRVRTIRGTEFASWVHEKGRGGAIRAIKPSSFDKRHLLAGDLLIEVSGGGPKQPVGRCLMIDDQAIASSDLPLSYSNFVRRLRLKANVEPRFADLFLQFAHASGLTEQYQTQTTNLRNLDFDGYLDGIQIPVPSLAEQREIVARVESLAGRVQELRSLNVSLLGDTTRLIAAEYARISKDAPMRPFGEVAKLVRRQVEARQDRSYFELGIRSFGRGTFHKPALTGQQLGNKRVFGINPGDLVFMNVFAWEGAIAVAKPEDQGRVGSHRFMAHEVDPAKATAEFLCYHLLTERGLEDIRAASPGSAGRNRTLGIKKLEKIPVPVPPMEAQHRFTALCALRDKLGRLNSEAEVELAAFTPALLSKAFCWEL